MTEPNTESIDLTLIETGQVMEKYGIASRATWGEWLKRTKIKSFKKGRKSYIYAYQLEILDKLAQHMKKRGATLESFHPLNESLNESPNELDTPFIQQQVEPPTRLLNESLIAVITQLLIKSTSPQDPEEKLLRLERIAEKGWWMRGKELAEILKISRMPSSPYSARGFIFTRYGRWWIVEKVKRDS